MTAIRDDFNAKFVYFSPVRAEELAQGPLAPERFALHIDEAIRAFCVDHLEAVLRFELDESLAIELLRPLTEPGTVRIDLWVESIEDATCTYGFLCSSVDGCTAYARGERAVTKLDPRSHRPTPWSETFRQTNAGLLRDLHAFA
jgi:hypothetical protein